MQIIPATSEQNIAAARLLFREYADSLPCSLCFQGFDEELSHLPDHYAPPDGRLLLLTTDEGLAAGCVAVRQFAPSIAEMKRLYIRAQWRTGGWGRQLAQAAIAEARQIGYSRIRLDTLPTMTEAIGLYRSLGFEPIPAYRLNPIPGAVYLELKL
jgi:putative acetyltransferase